jgi:hypothetical protein
LKPIMLVPHWLFAALQRVPAVGASIGQEVDTGHDATVDGDTALRLRLCRERSHQRERAQGLCSNKGWLHLLHE